MKKNRTITCGGITTNLSEIYGFQVFNLKKICIFYFKEIKYEKIIYDFLNENHNCKSNYIVSGPNDGCLGYFDNIDIDTTLLRLYKLLNDNVIKKK
jgi:hypothetical protein